MSELRIDTNYLTELILEYGELIDNYYNIYKTIKRLDKHYINDDNWQGLSKDSFILNKKNAEEQLIKYIYKLDVITHYLTLVQENSNKLINLRDSLFSNNFGIHSQSTDSLLFYKYDVAVELIQQLNFLSQDFVNVYDNLNEINIKLASVSIPSQEVIQYELAQLNNNNKQIHDVVSYVWQPLIVKYFEQFNTFNKSIIEFDHYCNGLLHELLNRSLTPREIEQVTELVLQSVSWKHKLIILANRYNIDFQQIVLLNQIINLSSEDIQTLTKQDEKTIINFLSSIVGKKLDNPKLFSIDKFVREVVNLYFPDLLKELVYLGPEINKDDLSTLLFTPLVKEEVEITPIAEEFKRSMFDQNKIKPQLLVTGGNNLDITKDYRYDHRDSKVATHHGMSPQAYAPANNATANYTPTNNGSQGAPDKDKHLVYGMAAMTTCGVFIGSGMALSSKSKKCKTNKRKR